MSDNIPRVEKIDGELVLIDLAAASVIEVVNKHNCEQTLNSQRERVEHFKRRITELGHSSENVIILLANVDSDNGVCIAELTMPGHDWQQYRDKGEKPFARGLCDRQGIELFLSNSGYHNAEQKLKNCQGIAIVVIDYDTAEVFCE